MAAPDRDEHFLRHDVWCKASGGGTYLIGRAELLDEAIAIAQVREKNGNWSEVWITDQRRNVVWPLDEYEVVTKVTAVSGEAAQEKVRAGGIRPERSRNLRWMEPFK